MSKERIEVLGCPVDNLSMNETLEEIDKIIQEGKPKQHVVVNAAKLVKLREDKSLKEIISSCAIINVDGMPLVWVSRMFRKPLKERVAGIDLMHQLVLHSAGEGYKPFFLGAKEEIVKKVVDIYREMLPDLKIAGYRNGYWKPEEENGIVKSIKEQNADILFVAFGSPKKEIFLNKHLKTLDIPFVMGVGGSFDVVAGFTNRAPVWMQKVGLEWFYRFLQEPGRMWKRYLVTNSKFIFIVFKEYFRFIFRKKKKSS